MKSSVFLIFLVTVNIFLGKVGEAIHEYFIHCQNRLLEDKSRLFNQLIGSIIN